MNKRLRKKKRDREAVKMLRSLEPGEAIIRPNDHHLFKVKMSSIHLSPTLELVQSIEIDGYLIGESTTL